MPPKLRNAREESWLSAGLRKRTEGMLGGRAATSSEGTMLRCAIGSKSNVN